MQNVTRTCSNMEATSSLDTEHEFPEHEFPPT